MRWLEKLTRQTGCKGRRQRRQRHGPQSQSKSSEETWESWRGLALWGGSQWPSAEQKTQPSDLPFSSWNVRCHILPQGLGTCSVPCLSALPPGLHLVKPSNPASSSEASLPPNWPLGPPPAHVLPGYLLRALPQEACCLSGSFQSPSEWKSLSIHVS